MERRPWPGARLRGPSIVPVFLPFMGCAVRCVFCRQDQQTGAGQRRPGAALRQAWRMLKARRLRGLAPAQLAFYGGTFTALPAHQLDLCLKFAARARELGLAESFRCSTRPDCVDGPLLRRLAGAGLAVLELGAQSLCDQALAEAGRGYAAADVARACALAREAGLSLCLQLLPGMPGSSPPVFLEDVRRALALGAEMLRFYPCQVLAGTPLAGRWRQGAYAPWDLALTVKTLARAWLLAAEAGVPVIRMGLAPQPELATARLAGPHCADLGSRVMARALWLAVSALCRKRGAPPLAMRLPRSCQGYWLGHGGELAKAWRRLGLEASRVEFGSQAGLEILFGSDEASRLPNKNRQALF